MKKTIISFICATSLLACGTVEGPRTKDAGIEMWTGAPTIKINHFSGLPKSCTDGVVRDFKKRPSGKPSLPFAAAYSTKDCNWHMLFEGNSRKGINAAAKARCEEKFGETCYKVADLIPANYKASNRIGVDSYHLNSITKKYMTSDNYGAISISDTGASNMSWNYDDLEGAVSNSLTNCNKSIGKGYADDGSNVGIDKFSCQVVHTRTPDGLSAPVYVDGVQQ